MAQEPIPITLKSYRVPWKGQALLACGKCQRKLKHSKNESGLGNLKKTLKKLRRTAGEGPAFRVIKTPCLDVCPRGGVVICTQAEFRDGRFSILRSKSDVAAFYGALSDSSAKEEVEG